MNTGGIFVIVMFCLRSGNSNSLHLTKQLCKFIYVCICVQTEIEMVVMETCKVSELTEQNITDEEKTAAATRTHTQRSRYMNC